MGSSDFDSRVAGIAALKDPTRRALYSVAVSEARAVSRDEAAEAVGVPRSVAAFHLDRLVEAGLLEVEFRRLTGRRGPGAGRPSKLYRRSEREVEVSLPERRYDLAGRLLARAVNDALSEDVPVGEALSRAAIEVGTSIGETDRGRARPKARAGNSLATVAQVLEEYGFEPRREGGDVVLGNCPFHALAEEYTDLVCGMNVHLIEGLLAGLGASRVEARLDPQPGRCCVRIRAA